MTSQPDTSSVRRQVADADRPELAHQEHHQGLAATRTILSGTPSPSDQCMHCLDPACVSGCPFHALYKGKWGVVEWDGSLCIGCRYCEVACPFDVPKFEWDKFNPEIVKCELCRHRLEEETVEPGCTEACPTGRGDLRQPGQPAGRGQTPHRGESRAATSRIGSTARWRTQGRRCCTSRRCRSRSWACPDLPHDTSVAEYATSDVTAMLYQWLALAGRDVR
jgi:Fe-S-cluster-containing dehydrogenase component